VALANDRVIRVLTGVSAASSGRTIYDPAIANTAIDEQLARFDPFLQVNNSWDRIELPSAFFLDPDDPLAGTGIFGTRVDQYRMNAAVTKVNPLGGQWRLGIDVADQFRQPGVFPLNPETTSSLDLGYTQPLLQGFGRPANLAPVVLARIDTERSFFQLKDSVQEQVRGVIEGYWNLVAARVAVWATEQQVEQAEFAFRRAEQLARLEIERGSTYAQARTTLANFRANLVAARADALQREAALRNLLGLPPWDQAQIVPSSEPTLNRLQPDWYELVTLAAERRPDIVELKLILEADEQQLIIANNNALPRLDAVALYRWNGLEGETPTGGQLGTAAGQFTDWTLGVNFSVPLGLRRERAQLRRQELILARDRANLDQGLHAASHDLATAVRDLDRAYEQYLAFRAAREAAEFNLRVQRAEFGADRINYLNLLLAITDWGDAVRSEAQAVTQYNTLLAELERQTGTILETHGIRFYEERYGSIGPLGRLAKPVCYPQSTPPTSNWERYPDATRPAEQIFNLQPPSVGVQPQREELLPPPPPENRP
jgi:outer membrane protein TolC